MINVFEMQQRLVSAALPSGFEKPQAEVLKAAAKPFVDEIYTDTMGNLICHKKGKGKKIMMPAHMDVIGFMAMYIDDRGFVRFGTLGGISMPMAINTPIRFENGVRGCVRPCAKAEIKEKTLAASYTDDFYIDIGARDRAEAESLVNVGSVAVFDYEPRLISGGCMMTPYADNLASCIALLIAMENLKNTDNDLYFVFTVQEEVGCRGAAAVSARIQPDFGIAVDLTRTGDTPTDTVHMAVSVGKGPTIKYKDSLTLCNPQVIDHLKKAAKRARITCQNEVLLAGATDAFAMQTTAGGSLSGCVSIPGRNIHSPAEIVSIKDVEQAGRLLAEAASMEF